MPQGRRPRFGDRAIGCECDYNFTCRACMQRGADIQRAARYAFGPRAYESPAPDGDERGDGR